MRLYAIFCYAGAVFYVWTAIQTMRTGVATPLRGDTAVEHRREDRTSNYQKYLLARWLIAVGLVGTGIAMTAIAGRFEKLEQKK